MAIEHSTITSANCHEPKHITSATTADTGKVITPSDTVNGTSELRLLTAGDIAASGRTKWAGWGFWEDSSHTSGSPFSPTVKTQLTVDGAGTLTDVTEISPGSVSWWNTTTNKIQVDNAGDLYLVTLHFHGETGTASSYVEVELDVGGTTGELYTETKVFPKGSATEHGFVCSWVVPAIPDLVTNGGTIYFTPSTSDQDFWKVQLSITKVYSGA